MFSWIVTFTILAITLFLIVLAGSRLLEKSYSWYGKLMSRWVPTMIKIAVCACYAIVAAADAASRLVSMY